MCVGSVQLDLEQPQNLFTAVAAMYFYLFEYSVRSGQQLLLSLATTLTLCSLVKITSSSSAVVEEYLTENYLRIDSLPTQSWKKGGRGDEIFRGNDKESAKTAKCPSGLVVIGYDLNYTAQSRKLANIRIICSVPNKLTWRESTVAQMTHHQLNQAQVFTVGIATATEETVHNLPVSSNIDGNKGKPFTAFHGNYANGFVSISSSSPPPLATSTSSPEYALIFNSQPVREIGIVKRHMTKEEVNGKDKIQVYRCSKDFALCGVTAYIMTTQSYERDAPSPTPLPGYPEEGE